ncbi:MAG: pyruvate kinase [Candidatus Caenarcaniphilales bacterium]|nr:pyruvate kinase [Candidatus Caenarcaniphilales bacterium]
MRLNIHELRLSDRSNADILCMSKFVSDRHAKIICTIGPNTRNPEKIRELILAGMDVARLNFSHGVQDDHILSINLIREISQDLGKPIAILQDLQGPKIRTGKLSEGPIKLTRGQKFTITTEQVSSTEGLVSTTYRDLARDLKPGNLVLIDDGLLQLKVLESDGVKLVCEVIHGGLLKDNKGINIPEVKLTAQALTEKDIEDLKVAIEYDLEFIALSFVRQASDVVDLKDRIKKTGRQIPVIAKIEKPQALEEIDAILDVTDGIMVARGDLGVELSPEKVPVIQKILIQKANQKGVTVITATQMLESMIKNPSPTRAEASDVANAIIDDTDAVMLSGETAYGDFPIETVKMMSRIIQEAESAMAYPRRAKTSSVHESLQFVPPADFTHSANPQTIAETISKLACQAAIEIGAKAVVTFTSSGKIASMISKSRPNCPIVALSPYTKTQKRVALYWGVQAMIVNETLDSFDKIEEMIQVADNILIESGHFEKGDPVVFTFGSPMPMIGKTNVMKLHHVGSYMNIE